MLLATLPVYNLVVYQQQTGWLLPGLNVRVAGLQVSDLFLLGWLAVVAPVLLWHHWAMLRKDRYLLLSAALLAWRIGRDVSLGNPVVVSYLPGSALLLAVYAAASQADLTTLSLLRIAQWSIAFYALLGAAQIAAGNVVDGRVQSIFGNPTFLALYMLHMLLLLAFAPAKRLWKQRAWQGLALAGIVMSRTRSVLLVTVVLSHRLWGRRGLVVLGGLALLAVLAPSTMRLDDQENLWSVNARIGMARRVAEHVMESNWLLGEGTDAIKHDEVLPAVTEGKIVGYFQPQNHYLLMIAEVGLVGLALWVGGIAFYVHHLWVMRRDRVVGLILLYISLLLVVQMAECNVMVNTVVSAILGLGVARAQQCRRVLTEAGRLCHADRSAVWTKEATR